MYLDLIPISAQQKNMRYYLTTEQWDLIRHHVYLKYKYRCAICGGQGNRHPVEAHEEWAFSHDTIILVDVVALCPYCHKMKHMNFYRDNPVHFQLLVERYARLNDLTIPLAFDMVYNQIDMYTLQMKKEWKLDTDSVHRYYEEVKEICASTNS